MLAVSLSVDASLISGGLLTWLLSLMGTFLRWLIVFATILLLCFKLKTKLNQYSPPIKPFSFFKLSLHLILFSLFFTTSLSVFDPAVSAVTTWQIVWLLLAFLVFVSWLNMWVSVKDITAIYVNHRNDIFASTLIATVVILLNFYAKILWEPLVAVSLNSTEWALSLFFSDVYVNTSEKLLGVNDFIVHISSQCSGLEGLVIALSVTSIYLFILRAELRFPLVFILLPVAALLAVMFNIIRLTMLISIGALYSPEIAVGGFHSVAGWLTAILVSFLIVFVFTSMNIFKIKPNNNLLNPRPNKTESKLSDDSQLAWAILVPFVLFLVTSLFSNIFLDDFNYWYPLKIIVAILSLLYFWSFYLFIKPKKWLEPIFAGFIVAVLWVILVPASPEYNVHFIDSIQAMPLWLMLGWCVFRIIGFCLIAPILEELAFRGYLLARVSQQPLLNINQLTFSLIALIISSIIFGFIHSDVIAGFMAGIIFGVIRYRHHNLVEPIISHISANIFVAIWAVMTGQWVLL